MKTLVYLYRFTFRRWVPFVFGSILMIIGMALANLAPFFVKWLTESVQAGQLDQAGTLIMIFGVLMVLSNFLDNVAYYITDKNMVGTSIDISQAVLTHIHNLDFAYHTNKSSGKLISMMKRGDEAFFTYYDIINRQFVGLTISFLVMFTAFSQLRWHYLAFVAALFVASVLVSHVLIKENIRKRKIFNEADDDLSSARVDNLINFDTVKYFAHESFEQKRFWSLLGKWYDTLQGYFFTFRYFDGIVGNIINVALVGMMVLALADLKSGTIGLPDFLLIITFAMTLFPRMLNLLYQLRELAKKYTELEAYFELLKEPISVKDPVEPLPLPTNGGEITFDNVSFGYDAKAEPILKEFSLSIKNGESVALVGYSGAGKTTIGKLLMRMYDPQAGVVKVNGVDVRDVKKSDLRTVVGVVPQDPLLFNNTIYYNIAYAKSQASKAEVMAVAKAASVDDFVQKLPKGYDTTVGERGIKLSGGQRQRLAIARVLLEEPRILVLDEATSALDSASEQSIQAAFWKLVKDKENPRTSIIIAHRLSTIMRADRIVVMDKGRIVEIGSHQELLKNKKGIYHKLWSLQRDGFIGDGE